MKKILDFYANFLWTLAAIFFFAIFAVNLANIFTRTFLGFSLLWSMDFSMLMISWSMMLAIATAVYRYDHLVVTFVVDFFPWQVRRSLFLFTRIVLLAIFVILAYEGVLVAQHRMGVLFTILRWPTGYSFWALPVAGFSSALFLLYHIVETIKNFTVPPENDMSEAVARALAEAEEGVKSMK